MSATGSDGPGEPAAALLWEALGAAGARIYDASGRELRLDPLTGGLCVAPEPPPDARRTGAVRLHDPNGRPLAPALMPLARALRGEVVDRFEVLAIDPQERRRTAQWISATPIRATEGPDAGVVVTTFEIGQAPTRSGRTEDTRTLLDPSDWARGVEQELDRAAASGEATTIAMLRPCPIRSALGPNDPLPPSSAREVADHWLEISRATDLLGSWREGEFGLVLASCGADQGVRVLRRFIERMPNSRGSSVGLTQWDGDESAADLIERAESALYEALRLGGGRIFVPEYAVLAA